MPINNARIAKNTLFLYTRQILIMFVGLYTSRVVLETLGVQDFGIFNLVGGIVLMLNFFNNSMATAIQRFFSFEVGRENYDQLKKIFNLSLLIFASLGIFILLLTETVGFWFVNNILTLPAERRPPAMLVYHFAALSFLFTILACPFTAMIFAREDMKIYSYVSFVEVILRLIIVYLLRFFTWDKLSLYGLLVLFVTVIIQLSYIIICKIKYKECAFSFYWNKSLYKEISSFSGWSILGSFAKIFKEQLVNIVFNQYFSPAIIAARAIASKIYNASTSLSGNFLTAIRPQLITSYAAKENDEMIKLMFRSSKGAYLLLYVLALPLIIEMPIILELWLKNPPEYSTIFTQLLLADVLIFTLFYPICIVIQATGKIKLYNIVVSILLIINLPLSFLFLHFGYPPFSVLIVAIVLTTITKIIELFLLKRLINYSICKYCKIVILPILIISVLSPILPMIVFYFLKQSILRLFILTATSVISTCFLGYVIGLSNEEKESIKGFIGRWKNNIQ